MKSTLRFLALFALLVAVLTPAALFIYQYFQFGTVSWQLSLMSAERIVATMAKAVLFSAVVAAVLAFRPPWLWPGAAQRA